MLNKYLFAAFALLFALAAGAQTRSPKPLAKSANLQPMPFQKNVQLAEVFTPDIENPNAIIQGSGDRNAEEIVGMTRWDAQGYGCVPSRVYYKPNGDPVSTWTHATDPTDAFPERGTGYSTRSGGNWSPSNARIESTRTGFPSASILSDGTEVVVAHATGFSPYRLLFLRRPAGATAWTESFLDLPVGFGCLWPHLTVGGQDGNTVHIIGITAPDGTGGGVWPAYQGVNGHILYWRSTDGGVSWDKKYTIIPGLDNTQFTAHAADEYTIDANGETIAVAVFPSYNDLLVFKSFDNGDTWETITAHDFPDALENYAAAAGQSYSADDVPIDTNAPAPYAVFSSDGWGNVLVDDGAEVHLFFGEMYYSDTATTAGSSFYPGWNGLLHWKESFGTDVFQTITGALDYDGDSTLAVSSLNDIAPYYSSLSSQPSSGTGADGTIYVGYSALHELYRSSNANQQFFRHVYILKSTDNGESWGDPIDLTDEPYVIEPELVPYTENVYPMLPRHIGDKVGLVYQQDFEAGIHLLGPTAAGNHPFVDNTLLWLELDPADIPASPGSGTFAPPSPSLSLSVSPNPATTVTKLSATLSGSGDIVVEVIDMMGSRVFQSNLPSMVGRQSMSLPVQNLASGTYWVRVSEGQQFGITKLVVAR